MRVAFPVHVRASLVEAWLEATLATYPRESSRLLGAAAPDRFRNPAGHTLREQLAVLFDAAFVADDWAAAGRAIDALVQLRAVQSFTADEAVAFVPPLKHIVRRAVTPGFSPVLPDIDVRVDRLEQLAREAHARCLERMAAIRANESKRRTWVIQRIRERGASRPND